MPEQHASLLDLHQSAPHRVRSSRSWALSFPLFLLGLLLWVGYAALIQIAVPGLALFLDARWPHVPGTAVAYAKEEQALHNRVYFCWQDFQREPVIKVRRMLVALLLLDVAIVVATQWGVWQTGRGVLAPLTLSPGHPTISPPERIWIDTDAACGAAARTNPDDCLAILWLMERGAEFAGVSSSFGNAPGDVVANRTAALVAQMKLDGLPVPPLFPGYGEPAVEGAPNPSGVTALQSALETGPLTILALGPLTNVAAALGGRPDLHGNVTRIVAIMGHRPGHLFHPTEGKGAGAIFAHGPIFRDLNVSVDPGAVGAVFALPVPITLIPYDAARATLITGADIDRLAQRNGSSAWVAQTTRDWLAFWKDDVGLPGFYPFDWIAGAYLADPGRFRCATVTARMTREWTFWVLPHASLVVEPPTATGDTLEIAVLYCPATSGSLRDLILAE